MPDILVLEIQKLEQQVDALNVRINKREERIRDLEAQMRSLKDINDAKDIAIRTALNDGTLSSIAAEGLRLALSHTAKTIECYSCATSITRAELAEARCAVYRDVMAEFPLDTDGNEDGECCWCQEETDEADLCTNPECAIFKARKLLGAPDPATQSLLLDRTIAEKTREHFRKWQSGEFQELDHDGSLWMLVRASMEAEKRG